MHAVLYFIHSEIGSQWSCCRRGVQFWWRCALRMRHAVCVHYIQVFSFTMNETFPAGLLFCKMQLHFDLAKLYNLNIHYFYWLFTEIQTVFALRSSVIYLSDLHHSQQFHSSAETQVFRIHSVCTLSSGQHSYKVQTHCVCLYATSVSSFKSSLETFLFSKTFPSVPLPYVCVCVCARAHMHVGVRVWSLLSIYNVCLKNW